MNKGMYMLCLALLVTGTCYAQQFTQVKHVVVIGVDGMSPDGIRKASTPHIDALIKNGAHTFKAQAVMPSVSSPNWASMIMGASPAEHEITSNDWERTDIKDKTYCGGKKGEAFPTIFKVIRDSNPEADIACFHDWDGFGRLVEPGVATLMADTRGEDRTAREAATYLAANKPKFTFIHLDHVDHAGHEYGHGSKEYYASVEKADNLIGELLNSLKKANILNQTLVLVTADHGGKGKGHGGDTPEERDIPWLISGPGVKKGSTITEPVNTYDTAATVAYIFGSKIPTCWIGKPVTGAFDVKKQPSGMTHD
jgi:predicted AlkP superfamily pyrophosphatase or phosphodiesterase